jgi:hypothetical protein
MQMTFVIVFAFAIVASAYTQRPSAKNVEQFAWLKKLTMILATIMAILIVINPEFYALGLLGDTAFFDLLVVALSLQLQNVLKLSLHRIHAGVAGFISWLMTPRPTFQMLLLIFAPIGTIVCMIQKMARRLFEETNCWA